MQRATTGTVFLAGLMVGAFASTRPVTLALAQPAMSPNQAMVMTNVPQAGAGQQVVVLDTENKVIACYHANGSGEIALKSVRNIGWDLQMKSFNDKSELAPDDIQAQINKR